MEYPDIEDPKKSQPEPENTPEKERANGQENDAGKGAGNEFVDAPDTEADGTASAAETAVAPDGSNTAGEEEIADVKALPPNEGARGGYVEYHAPSAAHTGHRSKSGGFNKSLMSYLIVGMVGAILGGFLVLGIAPQVLANRTGTTYQPPVIAPAAGVATPTTPLVWNSDPWQIIAQVAEEVSPTVVGVVNEQGGLYDFFGREYVQESSGSGVIVASDGYIVTNYHVVENNKTLTVYLADGRELPATVVGTDERVDLAVIKVDATGLPAATFGNSDQLRVGELAVAIGNPLGLEFSRTVTQGVVSGLNRVVDISDEASVRLIQTDAVINPGNSGGPLVNAQGEVIGINSLKLVTSEVEGMGFAIPSSMVTRVANEIIATGRVRRAIIGVTLADIEYVKRDQRITVKPTVDKGAYVAEISQEPAKSSGLRAGDVIVAMDGVSTDTVSTLRALLAEKAPGDAVALKVVRGSQELTIEITLGEAD